MKDIGRWFYTVMCPIMTIILAFIILNAGIKIMDIDFTKFIASIGFCVWFIFQAIVAFIYANKDMQRIKNND